MKLNKDPDFEVKIWIWNRTGVSIFVRIDEFKPREASLTIDLEELPMLEVSSRTASIIEQGTAFLVNIYPNAGERAEFNTHRFILKDEEVIDINFETESDDEENSMDIACVIKPKYLPAVSEDFPPKM